MNKILCIGNAVVDILLEGLDLKQGISKAEFYKESLMISGIQISTGGDAMNEATILGRLGAEVALVAGIGCDKSGYMIENAAKSAGVDTSKIVWSEKEKTQNIILAIQADKEKLFFREPQSNSGRFMPTEDMFYGVNIVSIASLYNAPFDCADVVKKTIRMAKKQGAVVCADVIYGVDCELDDAEMSKALQGIDYIFPNEEEAYLMTGEREIADQARKLLDYGIANVIIKRGAKGSYFRNKQTEKVYPALKGNMVDATGAGDSFLAGFCYGLANGRCPEDCFAIAGAAGLIAVESVGATEGLKDLDTLKTVLDRYQVELIDGRL